jgi:hypothetical protein
MNPLWGVHHHIVTKLVKRACHGYGCARSRETLLPRMADELQPYWTDFSASGGAEFGNYLAKRGG